MDSWIRLPVATKLGLRKIDRKCSVVGAVPMSAQSRRTGMSRTAHAKAPSQPATPMIPDQSTRPGEKLKAATPRIRK